MKAILSDWKINHQPLYYAVYIGNGYYNVFSGFSEKKGRIRDNNLGVYILERYDVSLSGLQIIVGTYSQKYWDANDLAAELQRINGDA
jgi:hypothetical protein